MGMLIDEEDCEVCVEFTDGWIFTYGDMVTLLLCFFVLLFSMCKLFDAKYDSFAASFKPNPPGSPDILEGKDSVVEIIKEELELSEFGDENSITADERGVVINLDSRVFFAEDAFALTPFAEAELQKLVTLIFLLPNPIEVIGHTSNKRPQTTISNWKLSTLRAAEAVRFLVDNGIEEDKVVAKGKAGNRPLFNEDIPQQARLNNRVEIIIISNE